MNKLDELIKEYCPDGVRYTLIGQCVKKVDTIKWKETDGQYQYIDLASVDRETHQISETQTINADNAPSRAQQIVHTNDVLLGATRPMLKRYCYIEDRFDSQICSTGFCVLRAKEDIVIPRWIYHQISSTAFFAYVEKVQKGASYPAVSDVDVKAFKIPMPPIEVQREIVQILDNFTELTAELTARKKQYEYYRDSLLTFGVHRGAFETKWRTLGEVCNSIADGDHMPPPKSDSGIPFITISNITEQNKVDFSNTMFVPCAYYNALAEKRKPQKGDILYTVVGSYGIPVCIENETEFVFQRHIAILRPKMQIINPRYMYHAMQTTAFKTQADKAAKGAAQKTISLHSLSEMTLPVPSLEVQERLIDVLDHFDAICSDLNIGLPAEIEVRKKQYEYYRDMLLTFAAADDIILTDRQTDRQTEPN